MLIDIDDDSLIYMCANRLSLNQEHYTQQDINMIKIKALQEKWLKHKQHEKSLHELLYNMN